MIHVIDNIYIDRDDYNYIVQEKQIVSDINPVTKKPNKNAGKEVFVNQRYYPNINRALCGIAEDGIDMRLINRDLKTAAKFKEELKEAINDIRTNR